MKYQILFWVIMIGSTVLIYWALKGSSTLDVFQKSPLWIDIIIFLLGLHLVITRGWEIIKRFIG